MTPEILARVEGSEQKEAKRAESTRARSWLSRAGRIGESKHESGNAYDKRTRSDRREIGNVSHRFPPGELKFRRPTAPRPDAAPNLTRMSLGSPGPAPLDRVANRAKIRWDSAAVRNSPRRVALSSAFSS